MLVVRDTQWRSLGLDRERSLAARLVERFAQDYPGDFASLGPGRAHAFIRETVQAATKRAIRSEEAIYGLVRLFTEFQPDLRLSPFQHWSNNLLDDKRLPGAVRINLVSRRLFAFSQGRRIVLHREGE